MYKLQLIAGLCLIIVTLASCCRLVCYYDSVAAHREWGGRFTIADIDPNKCTHLIYAFSDINDKHELVPSCEADRQSYWHFNDLKTRNPTLKTLLAVGGLDFDQRKFCSMVSTQESRAKFIQSAINLLRLHGFDGINLDWRNPRDTGCQQEEEKLKFTLLIKEMKEAFEAEGINCDRLKVTATVSAERKTINASYDVPKLEKHLDFINVLTYDFHGPWESVTGHHSPLYRGSQDTGDHIYSNADSAMQYWVDQGAPPQKLNMGFAALGRAFTLSSEFTYVGAPASGPAEEGCYTGQEGFWAYYETCLYLENVTIQMIPDQKVPYATTENQWVGYDNAASLDTKVQYLKANRFGGAFVWSLDLDDFQGRFCKQGKYPFISHLRTLLVSGLPSSYNCYYYYYYTHYYIHYTHNYFWYCHNYIYYTHSSIYYIHCQFYHTHNYFYCNHKYVRNTHSSIYYPHNYIYHIHYYMNSVHYCICYTHNYFYYNHNYICYTQNYITRTHN